MTKIQIVYGGQLGDASSDLFARRDVSLEKAQQLCDQPLPTSNGAHVTHGAERAVTLTRTTRVASLQYPRGGDGL